MPYQFQSVFSNLQKKKKKIDKTLLGFIRLRRNILLLAPFLCTSKGIGDYLRIHELVRLPFQPIQFYESCFIHREPDQTCDYLLLTRYPSSSTWEYPYHYLIDRNAIDSRPIRNWIYFPSPFFLFFLFLSIFIENHRLIIRIVHFQAISRCFASVKVKKKISNFLSSNRSKSLSLCKYYNISFVTTTIRKVFLWYFLLKNLNLNSATVKEAIFIRRFVLYFVTKKIGRILAVQLYFFSRKKFTKILNNN